MRYNIERIDRTLINILVIVLGILIFTVSMITTNSVLATTIITTLVTSITIPVSAVIQNNVDDYLSEYWVEAHKQGKEKERDEIVGVIGWNLQHDIFKSEVDVYDTNGEKETIEVNELIRKELKNHPTTNDY